METGKRRLAILAVTVLLAGCGGHGSGAPVVSTTGTTPAATTSPSSTAAPAPPGALQAEANSAAAGDIPDNQVFLTFGNPRAGYSMKYPEGWAQQGAATTMNRYNS